MGWVTSMNYKRQLKYIFTILLIILIFSLARPKATLGETDIYKQLHLTKEETEFLKNNKTFYFGFVMDYAPVEFLGKNGEPRGFGVEYLKKTSDLLNVEFIPIDGYEDLTWTDCLNKIRTDEIDILSAITYTEERTEYVAFTEPYLVTNIIVIGNDDKRIVLEPEDLSGHTLSLPKNYWQNTFIRNTGVDVSIINTINMKSSLEKIDSGIADYAFMESTVFNYYNQLYKYKNIKIVGEFNMKAGHRIGTSLDNKLLASILDKVIEKVPPSEVFEEAIYIDYSDHIDQNTKHLISFFIVVILFFIILTCILYKTVRKLANIKKSLIRSKEILTENLSHDLKTPLTSLKINIDLLKHGLIKGDINEHYKKIDNNISYLTHIINQLNEIPNLDDIVSMEEPLKSGNIISIIDDLYRDNIEPFNSEGKYLSINSSTSEDDVQIMMNSNNLNRALSNILFNALKYTERGDITYINYSVIGENFIIKISDTGKGINESDIPRIFNRFFRGNLLKKDQKGKGLGLAITKEIIDSHNGSISVTSAPNKLTTFTILLPIKIKKVEAKNL